MANLQIIKDLAARKNVTLDSLAKAVEISPQALSKLMRENSTKIETLEKIASVLGVSPAIFFETKSIEGGSRLSEGSVLGSGNSNRVEKTEQTSYGDHSPNVKGNGNHVNSSDELSGRFLDELAAQRLLAERTLSLLEKRDAQLDRLISLLEK